MNNYILVGKIINTFGIKGEVKINSNFEYKDKVFKKDFKLYLGEEKQLETINSYRLHKNYDLITFVGYSNINEILKYKGMNVYILRSDLQLAKDEYLLEELIGYKVYDQDNLLGVVIDYEYTTNNILFKVKGDKTFYIPNIKEYIKEINQEKRIIDTNKGRDLIL